MLSKSQQGNDQQDHGENLLNEQQKLQFQA